MRNLSSDIITKSAQQNQTIAADAEPYVSLRISRNRSVLEDMNLTEKVRVRRLDPNTITDADIAVCHPRYRGENTKIWCCYLNEGKLGVRWVYDQENITEQKWTVVHVGAPDAIACAICFDSEVVENARGIAEFVTGSENPLIFYVTPEGELKCLILGGTIIEETLAGENVTDVSAIRGPSSKNGAWDLGVTVFFLMGGQLFYRQLINGVWYDAELVNLGITGETIKKIDAFNTWDYRVGVQCLTQSGKLYQIITYTEGIGVRGSEHIEVALASKIDLTGIEYHNQFNNEHIEVAMTSSAKNLWAWSALCLTARNIEDEDENWGTTVVITFDHPNTAGTATPSMFTLQDSNGYYYACESFALSQDGLTMTLKFADFNLAARADSMTIAYTKPQEGGLMSPAVPTDSFSKTFVPTGLVVQFEPPAFVSAWNVGDMTVCVRFDEELTEGVSNANASHYGIQINEYDYVPNGTLQTNTRTVTSVSAYNGAVLDISGASMTDVEYVDGLLTLEMEGNT